ncbi:MAG: hypothetical protein ABIQ70_09825 [Dokdonella sp.]
MLADLTRQKFATMKVRNPVSFVLAQVRAAHAQFHLPVKLRRPALLRPFVAGVVHFGVVTARVIFLQPRWAMLLQEWR